MNREPIRVLHVIEATLGGVRRYVEGMVQAFANEDFSPPGLVYSTERNDVQFAAVLSELRDAGWHLFEVPMRREPSPGSDLKALLEIRRAIKSFQPHIVHGHSSKGGALARLATKTTMRKRPQAYYSPHAIAVGLGMHYRAIEWVLGRFATDAIVAVSESERLEVELSGVLGGEVKTNVAWPVIDPEEFKGEDRAAARSSLNLDPERPIIVTVGRLTKQKDPETFLNVIAKVREAYPDVLAIWVGDGDLKGAFEAGIRTRSLEANIELTGWQDDVRPYLSAADVMLLPSLYESFGYVTAEAMAMGLPVVATKVTGTIDIIRDTTLGCLFQPGDWTKGAEMVVRLLRAPQERKRYADRGRRFISTTFTSLNMRNDFRQAYGLRETHAEQAPPRFEEASAVRGAR